MFSFYFKHTDAYLQSETNVPLRSVRIMWGNKTSEDKERFDFLFWSTLSFRFYSSWNWKLNHWSLSWSRLPHQGLILQTWRWLKVWKYFKLNLKAPDLKLFFPLSFNCEIFVFSHSAFKSQLLIRVSGNFEWNFHFTGLIFAVRGSL